MQAAEHRYPQAGQHTRNPVNLNFIIKPWLLMGSAKHTNMGYRYKSTTEIHTVRTAEVFGSFLPESWLSL